MLASENLGKTWVKLILPILIFTLATWFYLYDYCVQVAPSVMTHQLMRFFHIGAGQLGLLGTCFFVSYTLMQIPAGALLDRFGARRLLTVAVLVSGVGVLLFGETSHFAMAGFSRFLVGAGSAFAFLSALYLASRWFAHRHFALLAGLVQFVGAAGSIVGGAPMAFSINHYGWRHVMVWIGLATLVMAAIYWLVIRDGHAIPKRPKAYQPRRKHQLSYVLRKPQLWVVAILSYIAWVPASVIGALWGVPFLMRVYGISNTVAGEYFIAFWLSVAVSGPVIGWLSDRWQQRKLPYYLCFGVGSASAIALLFANHYSIHYIPFVLFGMGLVCGVQSLSFAVTKDIVPPTRFATAAGLTNMLTVLSGATLQPLVGLLLYWNWHHHWADGAPVYSVTAYQWGLFVVPVCIIVGLLLAAFALKETHCQPAYEH